MPNFPKYRGYLPETLNPLNPRHYFLLAYWMFFRPTAFHCYLYQAAPECYQLRGVSKIRRTWGISAYRSLYLMAPVAVLLLALFLVALARFSVALAGFSTIPVNAVAVTPDGQQVVSASSDNTLKIWELKSGKLQKTLSCHTEWVSAVAVIPDGKQVISASWDKTLKVWELKSGKLLHTLSGHTDWVNAVAVTPDGKQVISASSDKTLKVWELKSGKLLHTLSGHTEWVNAVAVTPDGKQVISASSDKTLKVWELKSGKLFTLSGHTEWVNAVAVTPDGKQVISASSDNTLKVWELKSGKLLHTLSGHNSFVSAIAVTPDGRQVVSASYDNTLKVWELKSGKLLHTLSGHNSFVSAIAVTPDGRQVVSASWDNTLKVWELKSGKLLHTLFGHTSFVSAITVTPDGRQVVSASWDNTLKVWELNQGTVVPLWLTVWSFVFAILVSLAIINLWLVFPVILAISVATFGVIGGWISGWISGLISSVLFVIMLCIPISLVLYFVVASSHGFYVLGVPLFDSANNPLFTLLTFFVTFGMIVCLVAASVSRTAFGAFGALGFAIVIMVIIYSNVSVDLGFFYSFTTQLGSSRFIFYPIELLLALRSQFQGRKHPVEWDELTVLPFPGTHRLLSQRLQQNEAAGLDLVSQVARNPFQRSVAQKALKTYLHTHVAPLHLLYKLLTHPDMNVYAVVPVSKQDWDRLPTMGHLLLGELSRKWVNCSTSWANQLSERLVWLLTYWRRNSRQTPLTLFAGMLYQLLDNKKVNAEDFNLFSYNHIYARLTDYPGGIEIEQSFEAMASFLSYKELSALPTAIDRISKLPPQETAIRPAVMNVLFRLGDIAAEIATYQTATSRVNQLAALARATDNLDVLDERVNTELVAPEQTIIQRIIRQWRKLVSEAGGAVGRSLNLTPVANPYVAGNPVIGSLFVGRKDILRELEELWIQPGQCSSVVLFGHRRMGKSSILKNLGDRFGNQTIIVDFNMQRVGLVDNASELMFNLALAIYDSLPAAEKVELGEPNEEQFTNHNPFTAFDRFLKQVSRLQMPHRLIVTVDEFELIEKLIKEQRLQPELLDFLRGMIQTYSWFVMAFAGLYTLQDMTQNYWNPLFGSVKALKVSFLSSMAARQLITQPHPDFDLDYDEAAIEQIIQLTNGQPYLIQLICQNLITRYNRQMFEENISRDRRFTRENVEAIVSTDEFFRDGDAYFKGVWNQADSFPLGQTAILKVLCAQDESNFSRKMTTAEIKSETNLSFDQVKAALTTLENHDVIIQNNQQYTYTVELMRHWVAKTQNNQL